MYIIRICTCGCTCSCLNCLSFVLPVWWYPLASRSGDCTPCHGTFLHSQSYLPWYIRLGQSYNQSKRSLRLATIRFEGPMLFNKRCSKMLYNLSFDCECLLLISRHNWSCSIQYSCWTSQNQRSNSIRVCNCTVLNKVRVKDLSSPWSRLGWSF